jgi:hypothetical protein
VKNLYKEIEKSKEAEEKARLEKLRNQMQQRQQQMIRNIDPFEKKRRAAMVAQAEQTGEFSSRKVTSRKEEAELKRSQYGDMSPTEYMQMSKQSYYQEFERPKGSIYT